MAKGTNMGSTNEIQRKRMGYFLDCLDGDTGLKVLDIGSQDGMVCDHLLKRGHEPYGFEVVEKLVEISRKNYPQIVFRLGDCEKGLPFEDDFFDVIWAGDVIEHIHHTDVFVNEINRILKTGGRFILSTPMHNRLKNIIISLFKFEKHFDPEFPHLRFYSLKSLSKVLTMRGFSVQGVKYIGRVPILANTLFVISKKIETKSVLSTHRF